MAGWQAARGFEYQFLCTLEHVLEVFGDRESGFTGVRIEGPAAHVPGADDDIVDFALVAGDDNLLVAQVKSGGADSSLSASDVVSILLRLLTHSARRYAVITNRASTPSLAVLLDVLRGDEDKIHEGVLATVKSSPRVQREVPDRGHVFWERLRRVEMVLDRRAGDEVRAAVRERVRSARHHLAPSSVGWDAAGLLTGYLVSEVLAKAAQPAAPALSVSDVVAVLGMDQDTLKSLLVRRDWSVHVTPAPRGTDIARPGVLDQVAKALPTPVRGDAAPVCVLTGLSGIGKTSLAAAWADDRADAYAAILWIDATGAGQIEASFVAVAEWFRAQGVIAESDGSAHDQVFGALVKTAKPWLMVFDNCADLRLVREWIPRRGHGHTIVTTTDQTVLGGPKVVHVTVDGMTEPEAAGLLARRLCPEQDPTERQRHTLNRLANRLHRWPLALALAAAYLSNCLGGLDGAAEYERLVMRSLADEESKPLGYPRTLVNAITLAWRRAVGRSSSADQLAASVLRCAAFVASREIPLHLLLACGMLPREELAGLAPRRKGLFHYTGDDPPPGEIVRALKRDSLVTADEPFLIMDGVDSGSPASLGYTINMNDIIQIILQRECEQDGHVEVLLSTVAFHVQYWLSFFIDTNDMNRAYSLLGHAVSAAEHAFRLDVANNDIALLWGNTATLLGYLDKWASATRYLRAELTYLEHSPQPDILLRLGTTAGLAATLFDSADRPRDAEGEIIALLERFIAEVPAARELSEDLTASHLRTALVVVINLQEHGGTDSRLPAIRAVLSDYCAMMPLLDRIDWAAEDLRLNRLLRQGAYAEVRTAARRLLSAFGPDRLEYLHVLLYLAESSAHLRDWTTVAHCVDLYADAFQSGALSRADTAIVLRNLGGICLSAMLEQDEEAFEVFGRLCRLTDFADQRGVVAQAGDRDIIAVHRALQAFLDNDVDMCRTWLDRADLNEVRTVERIGMTTILHRLLQNWILTAQRRHTERTLDLTETVDGVLDGAPTHQTPSIIPELTEDILQRMVNASDPVGAPVLALALTQAAHSGARPARDPMELAVELCLAFHVLGFPAQILEAALMIRRHEEPRVTPDPTWFTLQDAPNLHGVRVPHHVVWAEAQQRFIDPSFAHLHQFRRAIEQGMIEHLPLVGPISPGQILWVLRRPLLLQYQPLGSYDVQQLAPYLSPERRQACEVGAFFIALKAVSALSVTGSDSVSRLESQHPHLTELLISPERLSDLMSTDYSIIIPFGARPPEQSC
ncbi:MAG: hypothetical protein JO281_20990 [Pseudonocardiales bacterium]|nr:hypothetical protein [Pseudonocardiales bacterium]